MESLTGMAGAVALLPESLKNQAVLPVKHWEDAEEIRIRAGRPVSVLVSGGEIITGTRPAETGDIYGVLEIATGASAYSARDSIKAGYVTAKGGYRIGVCGVSVLKNGELSGFRELSSAVIRIPRDVYGAADEIMNTVAPMGKFRSTLIVAPPGAGKTTLLRDMVRQLSDGNAEKGIKGMRVALADERGEIACLYKGIPGRNVGARTDVIDGCPKAQAVMLLVRSMNPQVIAIDEITSPEDASAIEMAANCGAELIATAHGGKLEDLRKRKVYRQILEAGVFENAVFIEKRGKRRIYTVKKIRGTNLC